MSQHSKAPWSFRALLSGSENDRGWGVISSNGTHAYPRCVAKVSPVILNDRGDASDEGFSNVLLITAAPEMYAALKEIARVWYDHGCAEIAKRALAKAEGREGELSREQSEQPK